MKKVIAILLCLMIIISLTINVSAESKLKQFEEMLNGEWERVHFFCSTDYRMSSFERICQFKYPAPETEYTLDTSNDRKAKFFVDVLYNATLTEDGEGQIYLSICLSDNTDYAIGSISFSDDGKTLLVFPVIGGSYSVYKKKQDF